MLALMALLPLLALLLGSTTSRPLLLWIERIFVTLLFSFYMLHALRNRETLKIDGFWLVLAGGLVFSLLQILPLPSGLIQLLSPMTDSFYHETLDSLGLYGQGQWRTLSLDVAETAFAIGGFATLLMLYFLAANLFAHGRAFQRLIVIIASTGFGLAMIGFINKVLGLDSILGLYHFPSPPRFLFSTFINPNHFAGFLGLCFPLQIGLILSSRQRQTRLLWGVIALITATALVLTLSRGGILATVVGSCLFGLLLLRQQTRKMNKTALLLLQALAIVIALLSLWLASPELTTEWQTLEADPESLGVDKLQLWQDSLQMAGSVPLTGVGAEAFKVTYPIFKTHFADRSFKYPENILLQLWTEQGFVLGSLIFLTVLFALLLLAKSSHAKQLDIAAIVALTSVSLHNMVDFSLTTFAVSAPYMLLFGAVMSRRNARRSRRFLRAFKLPQAALAGLTILLALMVLLGGGYGIYAKLPLCQERLQTVAYDSQQSEQQFQATMLTAIDRHPADYYLRVLASAYYPTSSYSAFPDKLLHLQKAQRLNPSDPIVDLQIARAYAGVRMYTQAITAYSEACRKTVPKLPLDEIWKEMLSAGIQKDRLSTTVTAMPARTLELAEFLVKQGASNQAKQLIATWLKQSQKANAEELYNAGRLLLEINDSQAAEGMVKLLRKNFPDSLYAFALLGETLYREKNYQQAIPQLSRAVKLSKTTKLRLLLLYRLAWSYLATDQIAFASKTADTIHQLSWSYPGRKKNAFVLTGTIAERQKDWTEAMQNYRQALTYDPDNGLLLNHIGRMLEKLGDKEQAESYYSRARAKGFKAEKSQTQ